MAVKIKECTKCGKVFNCGTGGIGHGCWCENLPMIKQIENGGNCLCASCLKSQIAHDISLFVNDFKSGKRENIAPQYVQPGKPLVEGIDYYMENELWVFTEWYHMKRGHCCGSGCRHCPYTKTEKSV